MARTDHRGRCLPPASSQAVEEDRSAVVGEPRDGIVACWLVPPGGERNSIANQAVEGPRMNVSPENTLVDAAVDHVEPRVLYVAASAFEVAEPVEAPKVRRLVLVDLCGVWVGRRGP